MILCHIEAPSKANASPRTASARTELGAVQRIKARRRHAARQGPILATISTPGVDGVRWCPRSSKPLWGCVAVLGGFDSHALPPALSQRVSALLLEGEVGAASV